MCVSMALFYEAHNCSAVRTYVSNCVDIAIADIDYFRRQGLKYLKIVLHTRGESPPRSRDSVGELEEELGDEVRKKLNHYC